MRALKPFQRLPFDEVPEEPRLSHPYMSAPSRLVAVKTRDFGDVNVNVVTYGSGPPLVLVHGLMTTSYSYRYVLAPLGKHFSLYVPDLVGAGRSDKPRAIYTPEALSRSLGDTIDALGVRGAPVVGNSLGGYLCMRLGLADPSIMSRLLCIHAPGVPTPRMRALEMAFKLAPFATKLVDSRIAKDPERWVHTNVHYYDESLKSREEHREYARPLRDADGRAAFLSMLRDTVKASAMDEFVAALRKDGFPVPLRLVYAEVDPMVPPSVGDALAALLPSPDLVRVPEASHFMHVDAPEAFLRAGLPFLLDDTAGAARGRG